MRRPSGLHPIKGYLPVLLLPPTASGAPVFSFEIASGDNVTTDPETGITRPASPRTISYEMDDTRVKRIGPDMGPIPVGHLEVKRARLGRRRASRF